MEKLALERVGKERVELLNVIVGKERRAGFSLNGKKCEFYFCSDKWEGYRDEYYFKVRLSDHELVMGVEGMPEWGFFSKELEGVDIEAVPEELKGVVFEAASEEVLREVEEGLGVVVQVEGFSRENIYGEYEEALNFEVEVGGEEKRIKGRLYLNTPAMEYLGALLEGKESKREEGLEEVMIGVRLVVGRVTLSIEEYKDIGIGDLVLLREKEFFSKGKCEVVFGGRVGYEGVYKEGKVMVGKKVYEYEPLVERKESRMSQGAETMDSVTFNATDGGVEGLPVNLVFEVGQKTMTFGELKTLKSGYTFELESAVETPVTIRANGRVVGSGELVQVDDRIGVRVVTIG